MTKPHSRKKLVVRLTDQERDKLRQMLHGEEASSRKRVRAQILLLSHEGWDRDSIATAADTSTSTIWRVRSRFCEEGLESALEERPRPGAQSKLSGREEQRIVALSCTDPPEGYARWSLRLLTAEAVRQGLCPKVSRERIRVVLHEHGIKPWREKNVVHSSS